MDIGVSRSISCLSMHCTTIPFALYEAHATLVHRIAQVNARLVYIAVMC